MPVLGGRPFSVLGMSPGESETVLDKARKALQSTHVHRYLYYFFWFGQKPE